MKYRCELDAINALVESQQRMNELLEQLLIQKTTATDEKPVTHIKDKVKQTPKRNYTRRSKAQ